MKDRPANWYCPNCNALRPARRRWGTLAHLHVWGTLLMGLVWWPWLLYWPLGLALTWALAGSRVCGVCDYPHLVPGRVKLRDLEAREAARGEPS